MAINHHHPHHLVIDIPMTTFQAYQVHLSCETSWPRILGRDPTNTQVGGGMSPVAIIVFIMVVVIVVIIVAIIIIKIIIVPQVEAV